MGAEHRKTLSPLERFPRKSELSFWAAQK